MRNEPNLFSNKKSKRRPLLVVWQNEHVDIIPENMLMCFLKSVILQAKKKEERDDLDRSQRNKKKSDTNLDCVLTLRRNHANLLRILPGFRMSRDRLVPLLIIEKTRAATGIEPVTSCTQNRNHTTRPSGLLTLLLTGK